MTHSTQLLIFCFCLIFAYADYKVEKVRCSVTVDDSRYFRFGSLFKYFINLNLTKKENRKNINFQ